MITIKILDASEVGANMYCNSRTSVLGRLHDYVRLLICIREGKTLFHPFALSLSPPPCPYTDIFNNIETQVRCSAQIISLGIIGFIPV